MAPGVAPAGEPVKPGTQNDRLAHENCAPEIQQNVGDIRRLVIGVGGVGIHAIIAMGYGLQDQGMGFGEARRHKKSNTVVEAVVMDSAENEIDPNNPKSTGPTLARLGVVTVPLTVLNFDGEFIRSDLPQQVTGTPPKQDVAGRAADRRAGEIAYSLIRRYPSDVELTNGQPRNPVEVIKQLVERWNAGTRLVGGKVYLDVINGASGGTGSCARMVFADAMKVLADILGEERTIIGNIYTMTGESIDKEDPQDADRRAANAAAYQMCRNEDAWMHGTTFPNGDYAKGEPDFEFIVDGSSPNTASIKPYDPASVIAKVLTADIADTMSTASSRSNKRSAVKKKMAELTGEASSEHKPLGKFGSVGASEVIPERHHVILERDKRRFLFNKTVGLEELSPEQGQVLLRAAASILPADLLKRLEDQIHTPTLSEDKIYKEGQEANVGEYAETAVRNYLQTTLPSLRGKSITEVQQLLETAFENLAKESQQILAKHGVNAENIFVRYLLEQLYGLKAYCEEQMALVADKLKTELQPGIDVHKAALHGRDIPWFLGRKAALLAVKNDVQVLVTHMNTLGEAQRDKRIHEQLLQNFIPQMAKILEDLVHQSNGRLRAAQQVSASIVERFSPEETGKTNNDIVIGGEEDFVPDWKEDPETLREKITGYSVAELQAFVESIRLTPEDTRFLSLITAQDTGKQRMKSVPLYRPSPFLDQMQGQQKIKRSSAPARAVEIIGKDGQPELREIPTPFDKEPDINPESNRVLAIQEIHGLKALHRQYFVRGLRFMLSQPPKAREAFFTRKGQMEQVLSPHATDLAKEELMLAGNNGEICSCVGCNLDFYRPVSQIPQVAEGEEKPGYCCEGCRKAGVKVPRPTPKVAEPKSPEAKPIESTYLAPKAAEPKPAEAKAPVIPDLPDQSPNQGGSSGGPEGN
jgi:hypothetical protein